MEEQNENELLVKNEIVKLESIVYEDEEPNEQSEYEEENESETLELKNVAVENELTNAVVIAAYNDENSEDNLIIENDHEVLGTYIVRHRYSTLQDSSGNIHQYIIESDDSQSQNDADGVVIEEYVDEMETSDSQDTTVDQKGLSEDGQPANEETQEQPSVESSLSDFPCDLCERTFRSAVGLKRHKVISHVNKDEIEDDPLTLQICACCGDPLDSNTHTVGEYQCDQCSKFFAQKSIMQRHTSLEHPKGDIFQCSECKFTCVQKEDFKNHLQTHSFKTVKCVCNKEFTRKYHLERHLQVSGCGGMATAKLLECEVCSKKFYRRDNLKVHMRTHEPSVKREKSPFECQFCHKVFASLALLNVHVRSHTGEKPFACDMCPKKFPSSGALKKHVRVHTGEKPYECEFCQNRFAAKETLNRHIRTHTGQKPHSCKFCGKSFIQAAQLRAHIFHHTGENAYVCQYCNRGFNRKLRLTTHVKYMHEGGEPLRCSQCEKTFFRKEDLVRHNAQHTGERPHACDICNKTFAVKSSLKIHKLTHKKEVPCTCEYCGRAFIRQDCLMRHMRARHREFLEDIMIQAEKKRLQAQLLGAISDAAEKDQKSIVESVVWNEFTLTESIKELLTVLVDDECLKELGYPDTPVDKVLGAVIRKCGHEPVPDEDFDYIGRLRENAKLLFTAVIDDEAVKSLLNNQTVDEVILHVLRLANNKT